MRLKSFYLFILLTLISVFGVFAQTFVKKSYYDAAKQNIKEEFEVKDTISNVLNGQYTSYYISGTREAQGQFVDNEASGVWNFYYESGKLKMKMTVEGEDTGYWKYYFESGALSMEGRIQNNNRQGLWIVYYEKGNVKARGEFDDSKMSGVWNFFYEDGKKKGVAHYEQNKAEYSEYYPTGELKAEGFKTGMNNSGKWVYYYQPSKPGEELHKQASGAYLNGKKTGIWTFYHRNGVVSAEGSFANEKPSGIWNYFYEGGSLSSKGSYQNGMKNGEWILNYQGGGLKSRGNYTNGTGEYTEYYESGEVKVRGEIRKGKSHGLWNYYYPDGKLEGTAEFSQGKGLYTGYYESDTIKTRGVIEEGRKTGKWELYDKKGELTGYYRPFYKQNNNDALFDYHPPEVMVSEDVVPETGLKKIKYFSSKSENEFHGVIFGANPLFLFVDRFPVALEYYIQERLGYELELLLVRDHFWTKENDIPLDELYLRGYTVSFRQKFYNVSDNPGLWYFGHELQLSNLRHAANKQLPSFPPDTPTQVYADEKSGYYNLIFGYRLMPYTKKPGVTIDAFAGVGLGYRNFTFDDSYSETYIAVPENKLDFNFRFGLNIGYSFGLGL